MTARARIHSVFTILTTLAVACFVMQLATVVAACSKQQRQDTIAASLIAVNAARDGFTTWDRQHEQSLLDNTPTREEFDAKITAHRAETVKRLAAFELAYKALATAATQTDDPSLAAAIAQAAELVSQIKKLTGGP